MFFGRKYIYFYKPKRIVLGGIICNKRKQRKMRTFDELFPPNYIILGGIIFSEINLRPKHKSDELYPPIIFLGTNYIL